jgi:sugar phosphate isomerase/epimerase
LFAGEIDPLDFPVVARQEFGIDAVEYVNQFFLLRVRDPRYLDEMKRRAEAHGVESVLVRISGAGSLGHPDEAECRAAVDRHQPWVEAAARLGCRAVSVSALSAGTPEEQRLRAAAGLRPLAEFAAGLGLDVLVESGEELCADPSWLVSLIREVDHPNCRMLADLAVIAASAEGQELASKAFAVLMPYAGAVRFTCRDFDDEGKETRIDVEPLLRVMVESGYRGPVVITYEGNDLPEKEGILAARRRRAGVRERRSREQIETQEEVQTMERRPPR